MTPLATYLDATGRSQRDFAKAVGLSEAMISLIKNGHKTPGLRAAVAIERETRGLVTAAALLTSCSGSDAGLEKEAS